MNQPEAIRRIQIGVIGVLGVLLLVSIANMALDRASDETPVTEEIAGSAQPAGDMGGKGADMPREPLAEIGLAPAPVEPKDTDAPKAAPSR